MKKSVEIVALSALVFTSQLALSASYTMVSPEDYQTFKNNRNQSITSSVIDSKGAHWKKYSSFLGKDNVWLWVSNEGDVLYWETESNNKKLLVDFNDPAGTQYNVQLDGCNDTATIVQKQQSLVTSAGEFKNAVELKFSGYCFDEGLDSAWFVPNVGLVEWTQDSLLGPVTFELQHAKVGGMTIPTHDGLEMTAQFPSEPVIINNQSTAEAYLTLRNHSDKLITLHFNSGQTYDIFLYDEQGELVQQWSHGMMFTQALQDIHLRPGDVHRFGGEIKLTDFKGNPLDVGTYRLKIEIVGHYGPEGSAFSQESLSAEAPLNIDKMMTLD
ncbi:BsuPI-related putative proteinase inhibitor [Kangiella sediminilitoris]|uniref:Intracellular proteinase inhibitor BsuPI domain-containing protein n=1 Tax=Kangiella sediminilitoris TaxID=1144748 RepID=A0A1B3BBY2_9GAMM|nr:BsuPI-related putative proteinase inhibitor [Kangiella sediminilitoris]AOE50299.1 hypothetical protein KS2013_1589 [Kangiella sediminilitoris]